MTFSGSFLRDSFLFLPDFVHSNEYVNESKFPPNMHLWIEKQRTFVYYNSTILSYRSYSITYIYIT